MSNISLDEAWEELEASVAKMGVDITVLKGVGNFFKFLDQKDKEMLDSNIALRLALEKLQAAVMENTIENKKRRRLDLDCCGSYSSEEEDKPTKPVEESKTGVTEEILQVKI